jgi:predicted enzyme related to lactoylglutathione lyase
MISIGDIHIFVHDFDAALQFWTCGLGFAVAEKETSAASAYALLELPSAGPAIHLFGGAEPWPADARPLDGTRPSIRFDVVTSDFDDTLVRLIESGGQQVGEIETYERSRVVTIADPDGNTFELLEVPEEAEA